MFRCYYCNRNTCSSLQEKEASPWLKKIIIGSIQSVERSFAQLIMAELGLQWELVEGSN